MRRILTAAELRIEAQKMGLEVDRVILVLERSMLKDGTYITRECRRGIIKKLYSYHFYCQMEDGTRESFRYNECLGDEARLICLQREYRAGCA